MSNLIRLSPTGIEYGDYAWNFASGCGNNIDGKCKAGDFRCWAYSLTQRFPERYPNGFKPTIYPEALLSPLYLKKPSRILCAFMGDLFWDCLEFDPDRIIEVKMPSGFVDHDTLKGWVFNAINYCPQHTFIFLTKQPQNLPAWNPFPENCWVGVTATGNTAFHTAIRHLSQIDAKVKYISVEPFLEPIYARSLDYVLARRGITITKRKFIDQVIIGAQTNPYKPPRIEYVQEIVEACDKAGVAVFLKDNLSDLIPVNSPLRYGPAGELRLRQEMPGI